MLLPCYIRQGKSHTSLYRFAQRLNALANDPITEADKAAVESQLVGFFMNGLYHNFLCMKVMKENPKTFQATVQAAVAEKNCKRDFSQGQMTMTTQKQELSNQARLIT